MRIKPLAMVAPDSGRTAQEKLRSLTPGQRSEFEAKARTLGLEAASLAAEESEVAAQRISARNQLSPRQAALGQAMRDQIMREREQTITRLMALLKQMNDAHARAAARTPR
jgi:hypothetical protein